MIAREKPGDIKLPTNCSTITSFHLFEKELHLLLEFKPDLWINKASAYCGDWGNSKSIIFSPKSSVFSYVSIPPTFFRSKNSQTLCLEPIINDELANFTHTISRRLHFFSRAFKDLIQAKFFPLLENHYRHGRTSGVTDTRRPTA